MTEVVKNWPDGGSLSVSYDGNGDGSAIFTADQDEGLDREMVITFTDETDTVRVELHVRQMGMREVFMASDGEFLLTDGGTLDVLKYEL